MYHNKEHVIPHPVIAAILDAISNIFTTLKTTASCQSNSSNTTAAENYQKKVIKCNFDFRLNFALKWWPSWEQS